MNILSIKLPKVLDEKLTATAKKRKKTKAALMLEALRKYLAEQEVPPVSAYELAKDYIGIIDDGPTDLSTNKKYMEGYGQYATQSDS
ncbi:MAG TPA: ribbon-helix-helix protein, CopG family [Blastocatellia bacterium]|nr:ribbon-helix-helix protein, CopG family [Blastocatellia bacterium]HMX29794.1 ribbon-helix-helix protein, CopG family [Blastocatellia bacterium]HMZ21331.1 ribbon-helix-helix protein, CopG family [Blastocatellia bacterium]HNG34921.1 ribbon-helix-helix protein, CopG family [Blastocatellia bacterium]